jgi:predicted dinucleotide-binding enzyme
MPLVNQDSGAQKALADADVVLRSRPYDAARQVGEEVEALDF